MARDIVDRLRETYVTAQAQQRECARVTIHVGQTVWDRLRAQADQVSNHTPGNRLFGFPILLESAWDPNRIEVRAAREIS